MDTGESAMTSAPSPNPLRKALADFVAWAKKTEGKDGVDYLNGDSDVIPGNGWDDLDALAETARSALAADDAAGGWRLSATIQMPYRKLRADALIAEIMHRVVNKVIDERLPRGDEYNIRRHMVHALTALFYESGAEVITDADRRAAGLEPRNESGLTPTELAILENYRTMKMLESIRWPLPPAPAGADEKEDGR